MATGGERSASFPAIEKKHGKPAAHWLKLLKDLGDAKYAEMHRQVHDWAYAHFPDKEHGEWYGYLDRQGRPTTELKGNMWKGPFHMPRQKLLCWQMLEGLS